jgi:hypothetical protein
MSGCSRKPDEQQPRRVGEIRVLLKVSNKADLPAVIPVVLTFYSDTAHTNVLRSKAINVKSDSVNTVDFQNMAAGWMYLVPTIDLNIGFPTCTNRPHYVLFVQQDLLTSTPLIVMTVRTGETECTQ